MKYEIKKEKNSKLELEVTIENKEFLTYWNDGLKTIQKEVEIDGFRKGMAPESSILNKYGEMSILQEMSNLAINKTYVEIIIKEKIHIIGEPNIHVMKLSKSDDFVYHAHIPVYPLISLPDYKKIANNILNNNIKEEVEGETEIESEEIAKIIKGLSEEIKRDTPDLENKIKENVKLEKELHNKNQIRAKLMEELVKNIEIENKDMWPENFQDKDKAQVIAIEISKKENITVSTEEIDAEIIKLMMHIPQQEIANGNVNEGQVKAFAEQVIINEKMFVSLGI